MSVEPGSRYYGNENPSFVVRYSGFDAGDSEASLAVRPQATCHAAVNSLPGTYPIEVSGGSDDKYDFGYTPGTLTVRKALLTVTADDYEQRRGEENPDEWTISFAGFVNGDGVDDIDRLPAAICSAHRQSAPGDYPIGVSGGEDDNYDFAYLPGTLVITETEVLPTAFTPNGDGINDVFAPGHGVEIFNRLGVRLYKGADGWDGAYKGRPAATGVYFYIAASSDGTVRKGTVEIIRLR